MDISHSLGKEIQKMPPDVITLVAKNNKHILEVKQQQLVQSNYFRTGRKIGEKLSTLEYLLISSRKMLSRRPNAPALHSLVPHHLHAGFIFDNDTFYNPGQPHPAGLTNYYSSYEARLIANIHIICLQCHLCIFPIRTRITISPCRLYTCASVKEIFDPQQVRNFILTG